MALPVISIVVHPKQTALKFLIMDSPNDINIAHYVTELKEREVRDVVRVCKEQNYEKSTLEKEGITVHVRCAARSATVTHPCIAAIAPPHCYSASLTAPRERSLLFTDRTLTAPSSLLRFFLHCRSYRSRTGRVLTASRSRRGSPSSKQR